MRFLGLALIGLGVFSRATAQSVPNASAIAGLWDSELPKRADTIHYKLEIDGEAQTGDCQVDIDERWILSLTVADGNLDGSVFSSYFRLGKPGDLDDNCMSIARLNHLEIDTISLKPEGGKLVGLMTLRKCVAGSCPQKIIKVGLVAENGKLILSFEDNRKLVFVRREQKVEK